MEEETKKLRTQQEINQAYTQCAMQLGDLVFKSHTLLKQVDPLNEKIAELKVKMKDLVSEVSVERAVKAGKATADAVPPQLPVETHVEAPPYA